MGVTTVYERIMCVRLKHVLGFMSRIAVYTPIERCDPEEKEVFCTKLDSMLDRCPYRDVPVVLGDFNAVTGIYRSGYDMCIGFHSSGTRNNYPSLLYTSKIKEIEDCGRELKIGATPSDLI